MFSAEYDCELDTFANGIWTATGKALKKDDGTQADINQRRCFQGIPFNQETGDATIGDLAILFREKPEESMHISSNILSFGMAYAADAVFVSVLKYYYSSTEALC